jgi:ribose transport system substrate-binding protein
MDRDVRLVKSVVHSSRQLTAFRSTGEALPLRENRLAEQPPEDDGISAAVHPGEMRHGRKGGREPHQFSSEVSSSLQRAALAEGIELISLDNRYSAKIAQRNADLLVREKVDLLIEFRTDHDVAPIVAAKYREAGSPLIAIDIPHPGATYYGANNYEAGLIAGRHLGRWVKENWQSKLDEIILLELARAGNLPPMRLTGILVGLGSFLPAAKNCRIKPLDGDGELGLGFEAVRQHLRSTRTRRQVVGAINDASALGALRAFQEAGRSECCAIMGHNASP